MAAAMQSKSVKQFFAFFSLHKGGFQRASIRSAVVAAVDSLQFSPFLPLQSRDDRRRQVVFIWFRAAQSRVRVRDSQSFFHYL